MLLGQNYASHAAIDHVRTVSRPNRTAVASLGAAAIPHGAAGAAAFVSQSGPYAVTPSLAAHLSKL
jgi:hypothetical protein